MRSLEYSLCYFSLFHRTCAYSLAFYNLQATPLSPNPPQKVHEKAVLWTEHHSQNNELLTAGADGAILLWGA